MRFFIWTLLQLNSYSRHLIVMAETFGTTFGCLLVSFMIDLMYIQVLCLFPVTYMVPKSVWDRPCMCFQWSSTEQLIHLKIPSFSPPVFSQEQQRCILGQGHCIRAQVRLFVQCSDFWSRTTDFQRQNLHHMHIAGLSAWVYMCLSLTFLNQSSSMSFLHMPPLLLSCRIFSVNETTSSFETK